MTENILQLVTFNVLAPHWVSPDNYPVPARPFLARDMRREKIITLLKTWKLTADVLALQETSETEFQYFCNVLKSSYDVYEAHHAPHYWSGWLRGNLWEPNGTALFIKKDTFVEHSFQELPLSNSGNYAAFFVGKHKATGIPMRLVSLHLDSDDAETREEELQCLLRMLPKKSGTADIIAGDFNFDVETYTPSKAAGFASLLPALDCKELTSMPRYAGYENGGRLDHILFRQAIPVSGEVFNAGILLSLPHPLQDDERLVASLRDIGSDHFPVLGKISLGL